jgi:hypothetical protein
MLRYIAITLVFFSQFKCSGQKQLVGLWGIDDPKLSYLIQQIQFDKNGRYSSYQLDHLRGWAVYEGNWHLNNDTVILNSDQPYNISYSENSLRPDILFHLANLAGPLSDITILVKDTVYFTDSIGNVIIPKNKLLESILISLFDSNNNFARLKFDYQQVEIAGKLSLTLIGDKFGSPYLQNEKWLLKNKRLYFVKNERGGFDMTKFVTKLKPSQLRYPN